VIADQVDAMTALRLTAIMKTDISGSTPRFRALAEADLAASLAGHRELVSRLAEAQDGRIVKAEGDAFWIVFPSVTAAALAATAMQEELRLAQPNKGDDRLAMRIVITLGDVLHEEGDFFGDAVALAARIEAITPADEIYLSAAARLAVSQAEIRTALVDAFALKGFPEPVAVYRIEQTHHTQVITDQFILFTDLHGFTRFVATAQVTAVEQVLNRLLELVDEVCREFGGRNLFSVADAHCMTFSEPDRAMAAAEWLVHQWDDFDRRERVNCPVKAAMHKGTLHLFRSYIYSADVNVVAGLAEAIKDRPESDRAFFVTGTVSRELTQSPWHARLQPVDIGRNSGVLAGVEVFRVGDSAAAG
jgi:class 3 adenylate cyclase